MCDLPEEGHLGASKMWWIHKDCGVRNVAGRTGSVEVQKLQRGNVFLTRDKMPLIACHINARGG